MIALPALLAIVLFGLLPVGAEIVGWIAPGGGIATIPVWAALYGIVVVGGALLLRWWSRGATGSPEAHEDDLLETGTLRGQRPVAALVPPTIGLLAASVTLLQGMDPVRAVFAAAALTVAFWPLALGPGRWLPRIHRPRDPSGSGGRAAPRAPEEVGAEDIPDADAREVVIRWPFLPSTAGGSGDVERFTYEATLRASRCAAQASRSRPTPQAGESYASLAEYVRGGLLPDVRRCAAHLASVATDRDWLVPDVIAFSIAFAMGATPSEEVVPADPGGGARPAGSLADRIRYPLECLAEGKATAHERALLAATLLVAMGIEPVIFVVETTEGVRSLLLGMPALVPEGLPEGRWAEYTGRRHEVFQVEADGTWSLGAIPADIARRLRRIHAVPAAP